MGYNTLIFINYRQDDCTSLANALAETFKHHFGNDSYFLDKDKIEYGKSVTTEIFKHLDSAKVFLVLIGPGWHLLTDRDNDKRLMNSSDWVRIEIEHAKTQNKTIIPLLWKEVDYPKVMEWLKNKVPSLYFMSDLKHFRIDSINSNFRDLLKVISLEIGIPLAETYEIPVVFSKEEDLSKELHNYYPLPKKYQIPKADMPFVGLDYFKKEDAQLFFGRTSEILKLCKSIRNYPLVLIYGQSGVGKSSLLNAGILPRHEGIYKTEYLRRDKSIGYHQQLTSILDKGERKPTLVILDQVEEIYTDKREDWRNESTLFWDTLTRALTLYPSLKFVLVFRAEHYPNFMDFLKDRQIQLTSEQELHLTPLNLDGIREAILGVANDPYLSNHFKFKVEKEMALLFSLDLLKDSKQDSHIGPLLQYQLRKLWDDAISRRYFSTEWVIFKTDQYRALYHGTLDELLDDQFAKLEPYWKEYLDNGLVLEILFGYTTSKLTATSRADEDVLIQYDHIKMFPDFFNFLKNKLFLLIGGGIKDKPFTRLAHDSLAPLIRNRFQNSNAPGQLASRLVEAKRREIDFSITFSESDIETIFSGQSGMGKIPYKVLNQIMEEQENYRRQKKDRLNLALRNAEYFIEHLRFEEALKDLKLAALEKIDDNRIENLAVQLLYPLEQLGQGPLLAEVIAFMGVEKKEFNLETENCKKFFPEMVEVKGGDFDMGSEEGYEDEHPIHKISISDFYMGTTPITWYQYGLFCLLTGCDFPNDSSFGRGDRPVINISWYNAVDYCNWLTEKLSPLNGIKLERVYTITEEVVTADLSKNGFRLPTEAEWEYAARERGQKVRFGTGMNVADPSRMNFDAGQVINERHPNWYIKGKGLGATTPVKVYPANSLGLFDMSGNVYEWCWDWYSAGENHYYKVSNGATNPEGPDFGERKVIRGGTWQNVAFICRSSYRYRYNPFYRFNNLGFRVVMSNLTSK